MDVAGWPSRRDGHRWAGTVAAVLGYRAGIECIAHLPDDVRRRNRHPDRSSTVFAPTGALPRARTSVVWLLGLSTHTFNQVIRRRGPETQRDPELVERRHFPESFFYPLRNVRELRQLGHRRHYPRQSIIRDLRAAERAVGIVGAILTQCFSAGPAIDSIGLEPVSLTALHCRSVRRWHGFRRSFQAVNCVQRVRDTERGLLGVTRTVGFR